MNVEEIMRRLINARKLAGLSQEDASKLLGDKSQTAISAIETGKVRLTVEMLFALADIYQVTPLWIFAGVEQLELEGMKTKLTLHLVVTPHGVKLENSSAMTIFGQGLAEETKVSFRIEDDAETRGE